ncbi:MAG: hypothetical protein PHU40_03085 [Sulfurimonas sp.]|nr:hypothetical protein [Sulfurimonas sp.]
MKKIIILLTLTLTLFASDACKLDIYFGNGVWNTRPQAEASKLKLKKFMRDHNPDRFPIAEEGTTYSFKLAYNKGDNWDVDDLLETFWQLHESGQIGDFYFGFITRIMDAANVLTLEEGNYRSRMAAIAAQAFANTQEILQLYRNESFSNNNNVLLVAHSQGNLFANDVYGLLTDDEKKRFQVVGVGVPADHVVTGNNYVTFTFDPIIQPIPNSLPANVSGFGHTFVPSYLDAANADAATAIAAHINNKVNLLDQNVCTQYKHFRWIGYMCPSKSDTDLEVNIYGSKVINAYGVTQEELVTSDSKVRVALNAQGQCPLQKDDYRTSVSRYDKNGCMAYTFDDTAGGYHSLDYIAGQTYENAYTCSTYEMSSEVNQKLKALEE